MKKRTYVQVFIAAIIFLFSMAAHADDVSGLLDPDQELVAGLDSPSYSVTLKKVNQDSSDLMDSMIVDRSKGEQAPRIEKDNNDGMIVGLRPAKRSGKRKS
ncbi:MAG: hypothetical protein ABL958_06320 [Bdellovibrionia bacterium]